MRISAYMFKPGKLYRITQSHVFNGTHLYKNVCNEGEDDKQFGPENVLDLKLYNEPFMFIQADKKLFVWKMYVTGDEQYHRDTSTYFFVKILLVKGKTAWLAAYWHWGDSSGGNIFEEAC